MDNVFDGILAWDLAYTAKTFTDYNLTSDIFTAVMSKEMPQLRKSVRLIYGEDLGMYMSLRDMKIIRKYGFFAPYYYVDENNLGTSSEFIQKWKSYHTTPHTYKNSKFAEFSDAILIELYNFLKTRAVGQKAYVTQNITKRDKYKTAKYKKGGKRRKTSRRRVR